MNKDPRIEKIENLLDKFGNIAVEAFHYIALFIIGCMIACDPSQIIRQSSPLSFSSNSAQRLQD